MTNKVKRYYAKSNSNDSIPITKMDNIFRDESMQLFLEKSKKNYKYIILCDVMLDIKFLNRILKRVLKYYKIDWDKKLFMFVFINDECLSYDSKVTLSGCYQGEPVDNFYIITMKIGYRIRKKDKKLASNEIFHVLWNELYHATGEKCSRFPPIKVLKKEFKK